MSGEQQDYPRQKGSKRCVQRSASNCDIAGGYLGGKERETDWGNHKRSVWSLDLILQPDWCLTFLVIYSVKEFDHIPPTICDINKHKYHT